MLSVTAYRAAVAAYLDDRRACSLSPATLDNYARHLDAFGAFCEQIAAAPDSPVTVSAYRAHLRDALGAAPSSIAVYLRDIRNFYTWACARTYIAISKNPVEDGMIPQVRKNPYTKLLTEEQIVTTLAGERLEDYRRSPMWPRNNAMAVFLLESACRISELCALTPEDLDWDRGISLIRHGKGDKLRYVAFPPLAQKAVEDYLSSGIRPADQPDSAPLFGTTSRENPAWHALTRTLASDLIKRHMKAVTGRDDIRPHALRHAGASAMLMEGFAKEDIQALLGHSSIQTTERYISRLRPEDAALRAAEKLGSLERRTIREVESPAKLDLQSRNLPESPAKLILQSAG